LLLLAFEFAYPLRPFSGTLDQCAVLDFQHQARPLKNAMKCSDTAAGLGDSLSSQCLA